MVLSESQLAEYRDWSSKGKGEGFSFPEDLLPACTHVKSSVPLIMTTPNREILTATDLLQCGVDSSHRLNYVGFQEMRKVE